MEVSARRTASSMRVATSVTRTSAPWLATPSESMVVQKGQAVAMTWAPVPMASRERSTAMRVPIDSSIKAFAPPPPQQKARSRLRGISTACAPVASSSSRGGE